MKKFTKPFPMVALIVLGFGMGYLYRDLNQKSIADMPLSPKRFIITDNLDPASTTHYLYSPHGGTRNPFFLLEKEDDCIFLTGEDWLHHDRKNPLYVTTLAFCPKKGAGWISLSLAEKYEKKFTQKKIPFQHSQ